MKRRSRRAARAARRFGSRKRPTGLLLRRSRNSGCQLTGSWDQIASEARKRPSQRFHPPRLAPDPRFQPVPTPPRRSGRQRHPIRPAARTRHWSQLKSSPRARPGDGLCPESRPTSRVEPKRVEVRSGHASGEPRSPDHEADPVKTTGGWGGPSRARASVEMYGLRALRETGQLDRSAKRELPHPPDRATKNGPARESDRSEPYGCRMRSSTPEEHLERLSTLEQELDDLYGDLGLPRPRFGELSVRRLRKPDGPPESQGRHPRTLRRGA